MRVVVQRVRSASVSADGKPVGAIEQGLLVLVGAEQGDSDQEALKAADRVNGMRIFSDGEGKMNLSLADVGGSILAISNFTLAGDVMKSRRPSFVKAAGYEEGKRLYDLFVAELRERCDGVEEGIFGTDMQISAKLDGPVTLIVDIPPA